MRKIILTLLLICGFSVITSIAVSNPSSANAVQSCQSAYPSDTALKDACIHGYNTAGPCTPYSGSYYSACQRGIQLMRDVSSRDVNTNTNSKCDVPGLGWIVCWVSRFIGWTTDGLFTVLEKMLAVPSLDQNQAGGRETHKVWSSFRNIANVVLVIVFLTVIFSQVTNVGVNNYGIKKLLPRMIVGAVLINMSFIICGLIVDVTNVAGNSIKDILISVAIPVKPEFDGWSTIISGMLVGGAAIAIFFNIFALAPILLSGLVALLMTVVILVVRQALIITLVILAPLAFALNILPSTQKWFGKWWSSFIILACVYPIIAFIFGATQVAAGVISASAPRGSIEMVIFGVFALGVQSIPFFITPLLMKAGGGLLNRFTGIVNDPSKGLIDRGRKRVSQWSKNKTNVRETNALMSGRKGIYTSIVQRNNLTSQTASQHKGQLKNHTSGAFGHYIGSDGVRDELGARVAKGTGNTAENRGRAIADSLGNMSMQIEVDDIDAAEAVFVDGNYTSQELRDVIEKGTHKDGSSVSEDEKNAAIKRLASQGNIDDIHSLIGLMERMKAGAKTLGALADGIDASGVSKHAAHLGPRGTQIIRSGGYADASGQQMYANLSTLYAAAAGAGAYNAETLASQSTKSLKGLKEVMPGLEPSVRDGITKNRDLIKTRDKLQGRVSPSAQIHLNQL